MDKIKCDETKSDLNKNLIERSIQKSARSRKTTLQEKFAHTFEKNPIFTRPGIFT